MIDIKAGMEAIAADEEAPPETRGVAAVLAKHATPPQIALSSSTASRSVMAAPPSP
jgi:hypothetical protein